MYILLIIMLACSALADFPYHSNTGNFNATTNATGDFNAFSWSWMGYDDQRINVNLLPSGYAMVYMRMCYPRRGTIFLEITDGVLATTNYTASISRSNLPPNGVYFTEFIGFETTSTSSVARSLATGMINIQHSLFENTTQSTWTNPAANTVIGPPYHTLSTLSLWPFVQTNQLGTGATWTGSNWTFATGSGISEATATTIVQNIAYPLTSNPSNYTSLAMAAALTNGLASLSQVATNVSGGYLTFASGIIGLTASAISNAIAGVYALAGHIHDWTVITGLGTAATNSQTAFATEAQGALADNAVQPNTLQTGLKLGITSAAGDTNVLEVSGAGVATANGTYQKSGDLWVKDGATNYIAYTMAIYQLYDSRVTEETYLYYSSSPTGAWSVNVGYGTNPAPSVVYGPIYTTNTAQGTVSQVAVLEGQTNAWNAKLAANAAAIATAGGVTGTPWTVALASSNLLSLVANGTCSIPYNASAPSGDQQFCLTATSAVVFVASIADWPTNRAQAFVLDLYSGANEITWDAVTMKTNLMTLSTNALNHMLWSRGAGHTNFVGTGYAW